MTEKYRFFDSTADDSREYTSADWSEMMKKFLDDGYIPGQLNELEVTSVELMKLQVDSGEAMVQGRWYQNDVAKELTLQTADSTYDRIDRIVLRLDMSVEERKITTEVKTGVVESSPSAPSLQRGSTIYELSLAQVYVSFGAGSIDSGDITDERGDSTLCGKAVSPNGLAENINYDNSESGIIASELQSAIDELHSETAELESKQTNIESKLSDNAGAHNSIYRGKYLGSSVTAGQYSAISGGTFEDLYIGDYWTIGGVTYCIACFNYFYNAGDVALTENHITLVPDTTLYTYVMNDTNITDGGYVGSKMYTLGLDQAKTTIQTAFSSHLVNHRSYLCNAVSTGEASGGAWFDSTVELMNEIMVYGSIVDGSATYGHYNIGVGKIQLPLFALRPDIANIRATYWLQDVASGTYFAFVDNNGNASHGYASFAYGVRPAFSIS